METSWDVYLREQTRWRLEQQSFFKEGGNLRETPDEEERLFWTHQYEKWEHYSHEVPPEESFNDIIDLKMLAASDVMDSYHARLTSFYNDSNFLKQLRNDRVNFEPFTAGLRTLSYQQLIWNRESLQQNQQKQWETDCCDKAMLFVETKFLDYLLDRGFSLRPGFTTISMLNIMRKESVAYLTGDVKMKEGKNNMADLFSSAFVSNDWSGRCCKNYNCENHIKVHSLSDIVEFDFPKEKIQVLLNILLSFTRDIPPEFQEYSNIFELQVFFLKSVLTSETQEGVHKEVQEEVGSRERPS